MKMPKVGGIVYAVGEIQGRVGETTFLCSTQENCERTAAKAIKEALEMSEDMDEDLSEGDLVVWEMRRIK